MSTPITQQRAHQALAAARRANAQAQADKHRQDSVPPKRYASCGAPVYHQPAEGEGLPCGH